MTINGDVNLDRVQLIMSDLGMAEDEIFKKRQQTEKMFADRNRLKKRREKQDKLRRTNSAPHFTLGGQYAPSVIISFTLIVFFLNILTILIFMIGTKCNIFCI